GPALSGVSLDPGSSRAPGVLESPFLLSGAERGRIHRRFPHGGPAVLDLSGRGDLARPVVRALDGDDVGAQLRGRRGALPQGPETGRAALGGGGVPDRL